MSYRCGLLDRVFESKSACDEYHREHGIGKYVKTDRKKETLSIRKKKRVKEPISDDSSSASEDDVEPTKGSGGGGNTKSPPRAPAEPAEKEKRYRAWFATINNPKISAEELDELLQEAGSTQHTFQLEIGKKGTPHFQLCVRFQNAKSFSAVRKLLGKNHIEPVKSWNSSICYCTKEDTRSKGPWLWGISEEKLEEIRAKEDGAKAAKDFEKKKLEAKILRIAESNITKLKNWQKQLESELEGEADDRKIIWVCGKRGGEGKTAFARYLAEKYKSDLLYVNSGKSADITFAASEIPGGAEIVIFNFTRTNEGKISYQAIEQLKDGLFFSPKYESKSMRTIFPHVVVFSNFWPDTDALSLDRWDIRRIRKNKKLTGDDLELQKMDLSKYYEKDQEEDLDTDEELSEIMKKKVLYSSKVTKEERAKLDKINEERVAELEEENLSLREKIKKLKKKLDKLTYAKE